MFPLETPLSCEDLYSYQDTGVRGAATGAIVSKLSSAARGAGATRAGGRVGRSLIGLSGLAAGLTGCVCGARARVISTRPASDK